MGSFWFVGSGNLTLFYPLLPGRVGNLQSLSWSSIDVAGLKVQNAISADPFESWVFALRLSALDLAGVLAVRFTNTRTRLGTLVHAIVLAAVLSAIFGILRQAMQHDTGFCFHATRGGGFAQFIKKHFAFWWKGDGTADGNSAAPQRSPRRLAGLSFGNSALVGGAGNVAFSGWPSGCDRRSHLCGAAIHSLRFRKSTQHKGSRAGAVPSSQPSLP
jgi:hypothetical protein